MVYGSRQPTSNDPNDDVTDDFAGRLNNTGLPPCQHSVPIASCEFCRRLHVAARKAALPLELTGREQEFFADLCLVFRQWWDQKQPGNRPMDPAELDDRLEALALRFNLTPQKFDVFYDKFHRAGANA